MSLFFSKLGFIHRRLWDRDGLYRVALFFGPAPLIGCIMAAAIWWSMHRASSPAPIVQPPDWGKPSRTGENWSTTGEPQTVQPVHPLPPVDVHGGLSGYEAGWRATIHPVDISATLNVETQPAVLNSFLMDGGSIYFARIMEAGPEDIKIVGTGSGFLVVRTPGIYALSLRFERSSGPTADCLTRLGFAGRRIVSNFGLATPGNLSKTFDAARFDLQPGLYPIGWGFGCWRDQKPVGPGRITVLISRPGDQALQPVLPEDIVRPKQINDAPSPPQTPSAPAIAPPAATTIAHPQHNATTSAVDQTSGLDQALLGRTFQDMVLVNGYKVPLPPGQWAMLTHGTVTGVRPENKGTMFFLGQIVHKRLVAAIWVEAMRSPGLGFARDPNCSNPADLFVSDEPGNPDHQGCKWIRPYFSANLQ